MILYRVPAAYDEGEVEDSEEVAGIKFINVSERVSGEKDERRSWAHRGT